MLVNPNDTWFKNLDAGGDEPYVSPYPNWSDVASKGFLTKDYDENSSNSMAGFADAGLGTKTAMKAYTRVVQHTTADILISSETGGMQVEWLEEIGLTGDFREGTAGTLEGLFAFTQFSKTTDPLQIAGQMAMAGVNVAMNFLGAIPVVGWIAAAAIAIGKAFYKLKKIADAQRREEPIIVPWNQQTTETDQWLINDIVRDIVRTPDWTAIWMPRARAQGNEGWNAFKSKQGDGTRVYGTFFADGQPSYHPVGSALGAIPNTQMIADFVQFMASGSADNNEELKPFGTRRDSTVNTGDFYPSVSQLATTLWSWANRGGSPDMYKIDTYALEDAWRDYWEQFFGWGFDRIKHVAGKKGTTNADFLTGTAIGKALGRFYVLGCSPTTQAGKLGSEGCQIGIDPQFMAQVGSMNGPGMSNDGVFTDNNPMRSAWTDGLHKGRFYNPFDAIIKPALDALRQRQWAYLARSTVCALVRYQDGPNGPAFAAFRGNEALAKRCYDMRGFLLNHLARYKVKDVDVRPVDPAFADELKATKKMAPEFPVAGQPPLEAKPMVHQAPAPGTLPPQGGVPFQHVVAGEFGGGTKRSGGTGGAGLIAAAALGAMVLSKK